jgi:hypothetical protein
VEHPCYKCGASVEDGTPFCLRCNAPQIRVAGPTPPAGTTPEAAIEHYTTQSAPLTSALDWQQALPSAGIALLLAFFLIPLGMPAALWMLAAGFLSVVLYRRRCHLASLSGGTGARLGALTGALGFAVLAAMLALWTAFRSSKAIHDTLLNYIQLYGARSSDPHLPQVLELFNTPAGFIFIVIFTLVLTLLAFVLFSTLGGALGAYLMRRKNHP